MEYHLMCLYCSISYTLNMVSNLNRFLNPACMSILYIVFKVTSLPHPISKLTLTIVSKITMFPNPNTMPTMSIVSKLTSLPFT